MESIFEAWKPHLPDFARDIRLNVTTVLTESGSPGLTPHQIAGIALASACATRNETVARAVHDYSSQVLTADQEKAAKAAASLTAMNNVYYRFLHLVSDHDFKDMPADEV